MEFPEPLRQTNAGYGHDTRVESSSSVTNIKLANPEMLRVNRSQHSYNHDCGGKKTGIQLAILS